MPTEVLRVLKTVLDDVSQWVCFCILTICICASLGRLRDSDNLARRVEHFVMKPTWIIALTVAILVAGCATQHHQNSTSNTPTPVAAQKNDPGWYLMQPPLGRDNVPDTKAKLHNWQSLAYFEHAADCDAARAQGLIAYPAFLPVSESMPLDSIAMSQRLAATTLCVAADDPRINWIHIDLK